MKIYNEIVTEWELASIYIPWGGANINFKMIYESHNVENFINAIEELYPQGISTTKLNDILWFDDGFCYQFIDDKILNEEQKEEKRSYTS